MSKEVSNFPWEYLRELTGIDDVGLDNRLAAASDDDWRSMIQTISHRIAPLAGFANVVELNNYRNQYGIVGLRNRYRPLREARLRGPVAHALGSSISRPATTAPGEPLSPLRAAPHSRVGALRGASIFRPASADPAAPGSSLRRSSTPTRNSGSKVLPPREDDDVVLVPRSSEKATSSSSVAPAGGPSVPPRVATPAARLKSLFARRPPSRAASASIPVTSSGLPPHTTGPVGIPENYPERIKRLRVRLGLSVED